MPIVILMLIMAALNGNLTGLAVAIVAGIYAKAHLSGSMRAVRDNVRQDQDSRLSAYVSKAKASLREARSRGDSEAIEAAETRLATAETRVTRVTKALDADEREFAAGDNTAATLLGVAAFACPVFALACLADAFGGPAKT